ncbi:hypothetical protein ACFQBQ_15490 [Granulicella cerasi]|uniref:Uncharacterized protein n=1 Tax=Granulicella cerasi TaxID=741063 RepID=A0ABW1ZEV5_9BACT|nr:hypothetical protein [Granulicella cerasi]
MTLKPRQIILLVLVLLVGAWKVWTFQQSKHAASVAATPVAVASAGDSNPVWTAFDHAASLRDASADQFEAGIKDLETAKASVTPPNLKANADLLSEVRGCQTWLEFYRSHKNDPAWKDPLEHHLKGCTQQHADTTL